jgi:tRNA-2-methylthio-N6-dimethylallyladenosine synthase
VDGNKVYLTSSACYIVQTETNHIAAYLKQNGYELVDRPGDADALVITTCAVTGHSADITTECIGDLIAGRKDAAPVYVVGCYTRIETQKMEELLQVKNVISVAELPDLEKEFPGQMSLQFTIYNDFFSHPFAEHRLMDYARETPFKVKAINGAFRLLDATLKTDTQFRYLFRNGHLYSPHIQRATWPVVVSKGCLYNCAYCAVRIGRGKHVSKPVDAVVKEIETGVQRGYEKVLLVADELGTYGKDLRDGTTLATLLERLVSDEYPVKLGMWYLDAFRLKQTMPILEKLAEMNKIFFLGITVQHGSERILKLMNRRYSIDDTVDAIAKLRKYPSIILATQFMVGYPTETEEDFEKTLEIVEKGYFDKIEVYPFSPRPGTKAAEMDDDVPLEIKETRAYKLRRAANKRGRKLLIKGFGNDLRASFARN